MTLFLCLVLSGAVLLAGTFLQASRLRLAETRLTRALSAEIQTCLASYDHQAAQFGLFGFLAGPQDHSAFHGIFGQAGLNPESIPEKPLLDRVVLRAQIIRYMKGRVPAVLADQLLSRLLSFRQAAGMPASLPIAAFGSGGQTPSPDKAACDPGGGTLAGLIGSFCGSLSESDVKSAADSVFSSLLKDAAEDAAREIESACRKFAAENLGASDDSASAGLGPAPDFLDPSSLSKAAGQLEMILEFHTSPAYEKICLVEYVMGQFKPSVEKMVLDGGSQPLTTLDGRPFNSFPDSRTAEVEQILTGISKPGAATRLVKISLTSLRCLIHLAALLSDQAKMGAMRGTAAAICGAVALVSGGTVVVDPETMLYLVVVGKAIESGIADYKNLAAGKTVGLWPGKPNEIISLHYQDYMRLFLVLVPADKLTERISDRLGQILPAGLFTAIRVRAPFRGRTVEMTGGYHGSLS